MLIKKQVYSHVLKTHTLTHARGKKSLPLPGDLTLSLHATVRKLLKCSLFSFATGPDNKSVEPQVYISHTEAWEGREAVWKILLTFAMHVRSCIGRG